MFKEKGGVVSMLAVVVGFGSGMGVSAEPVLLIKTSEDETIEVGVEGDLVEEGWVLQEHANNLRDDIKNLMIKNETRDFLSEEIDRLYEVIEETAGPLAADGGQLGNDVFGNLPSIGWERLSRLFLHS